MTKLSANEVKRILFLSLAGLTLEEADKLEAHIDAMTKQVQAADALADAVAPILVFENSSTASDCLRAYRATKPDFSD